MNDRRTIDTFVWLSLAFVVLIITLFYESINESVYDRTEEEYATYQNILAESSAKTLDLFFNEIGNELGLLARSQDIVENRLEFALPAMEDIVRRHENYISTILLVDYKGDIVADPLLYEHEPELRVELLKLYKKILFRVGSSRDGEPRDLTISDSITISGEFAGFALATPIIKSIGRSGGVEQLAVNGMVVALISSDLLEKNLLEPIGFKEGSAAFIITHTKIGMASPNSREIVLEIVKMLGKYEAGEGLIRKMTSGQKGTIWSNLIVNIGEEEKKIPVLVSFAPASFADVTWSVGIITPKNEITKLVQESRIKSLLLAAFAITVFYVGAILLMRLNRVRVAAQEKARYASELAEKNRELERLNKMKDDFVSIVSHDLRSPIGNILTFAKLLLPEVEKKGISAKPVKSIISSSNRLLTLVNDILDLARVEAGEMKLHLAEIRVDELMEESFKAVRFNAEQKNIELAYNPEPEPGTIRGDNSKLYQVLNNLIGNAIKFTSENGKVTVSKGMERGQLRISVKDTGPGLGEEDKKVVFEKFKQAGRHEGSGLGLAICKNLIELHKGTIWVESPPPGETSGAEFIFTVPLDHESDKNGN